MKFASCMLLFPLSLILFGHKELPKAALTKSIPETTKKVAPAIYRSVRNHTSFTLTGYVSMTNSSGTEGNKSTFSIAAGGTWSDGPYDGIGYDNMVINWSLPNQGSSQSFEFKITIPTEESSAYCNSILNSGTTSFNFPTVPWGVWYYDFYNPGKCTD